MSPRSLACESMAAAQSLSWPGCVNLSISDCGGLVHEECPCTCPFQERRVDAEYPVEAP
jgi:hypothetical protein